MDLQFNERHAIIRSLKMGEKKKKKAQQHMYTTALHDANATFASPFAFPWLSFWIFLVWNNTLCNSRTLIQNSDERERALEMNLFRSNEIHTEKHEHRTQTLFYSNDKCGRIRASKNVVYNRFKCYSMVRKMKVFADS